MSADEWPVDLDGDEFYPIPESWIEHGSDQDRGSPRIYAVSVASGPRNMILVRYASPDGRAVKVSMTGAENPSGGGVVPASLAKYEDWPRSMVPGRNVEPTGLLRKLENEHFRDLWSDRLQEEDDDVEAERKLVADGGETAPSNRGETA